jgi:hypothetical protein
MSEPLAETHETTLRMLYICIEMWAMAHYVALLCRLVLFLQEVRAIVKDFFAVLFTESLQAFNKR